LPPGGSLGSGRVEIEYSYRNNSFSHAEFSDGTVAAAGDLSVQGLLLNSFAEFPNSTRVTPYLGVGIGGALIKLDKLTVNSLPMVDDSKLVLAYQGGCGVNMELTSSLQLDFGYRFFATDQPQFKEVDGRKIDLKYHAHTVSIGLIYGF